MFLDFSKRVQNKVRGFLLARGPERIKRSLWNAEFSRGRWDNLAQTQGDCIYPSLERFCNGGSILDLGCGSGNTGAELAAYAYCEYTGVDISDRAIDEASKKAEEKGRSDKNRYLVCDISSYEPEQQFDVILFRDSIYYVAGPKLKATLDRYSKSLKPGGVFIVRLWTGKGKYRGMVDFLEANFEIVEKSISGPSETVVLTFRQVGDFSDMQNQAKPALLKLLSYCRANEWAGYDPYDALNSRLFSVLPFLNSRWPRLLLTQALKRSPVNVRGLLGVPKTQNPKALGLFLSAFVKFSESDVPDRDQLIRLMIDQLQASRSRGIDYSCWGYSFPWQMRKGVVPAGTPNLVCTTFVATALLDAYDHLGDPRCLAMAKSAAEYILNELYWTDGAAVHSFSYPLPSVRVQVYNANFLAASLLCRVSKLTGEEKFMGPALAVTRCSVAQQKQDGSWEYGGGHAQQWIDNFHTGFNLGALRSIGLHAQTTEFDDSLRRGFEFYRTHFFRKDGAAKYFHNRTYPIDAHAVAQSIITLTEFQDLNPTSLPIADKVLEWAMNHMWDERGFFYYRCLRLATIRTSYMRWTQAWMLLALATRLAESNKSVTGSASSESPALVSNLSGGFGND
jgi:SAM-dependent methyltransferase